MWCYQGQQRCGYWDLTSLDEHSSLSPTERFVPPRWTRSCWTVNRGCWQWMPSAGLWRKPVAMWGPQQLLQRHHQQGRQEPKHWR
uniref:Uncharacterized protein n=1 Tax=Romanomermis culicivorax TaxID=13658 RepID=A0A915KK36_ROMCU